MRTMRTLIASLALGLGAVGGAGAQTPHRLPRAVTTDTATTNAVTVQNDRRVPVTIIAMTSSIVTMSMGIRSSPKSTSATTSSSRTVAMW